MSHDSLSVAICVAGRAKTLAAAPPSNSYRKHLLAVLHPLLAARTVHVDLMLHLDKSVMHERSNVVQAAHELGATSLTLYAERQLPYPHREGACLVADVLRNLSTKPMDQWVHHTQADWCANAIPSST